MQNIAIQSRSDRSVLLVVVSTVEGATAFIVRQQRSEGKKLVGTVFLLPNSDGGELARPKTAAMPPPAIDTHEPDDGNLQAIRAAMFSAVTTAARVKDTKHIGRHYYVGMFAVLPEVQAQGIGASMLAALAEDATSASVPVFLYTGNARNLAFYQKNGYVLQNQRSLPAGGTHQGPFPVIVYSLLHPAPTK